MKKWMLLVLLLCLPSLKAMEKAQGDCTQGGYSVVTQGLSSSTKVERSFVSCTVTVYESGTLNLATLYNDNSSPPTPKANPFTSASDGHFFFYAAGGRYDVRFSNSDIPLAFTRGDYMLCDPFGPNEDTACFNNGGQPLTHNLLSPTHTDTIPYTPPSIGGMIRGGLINLWEHVLPSQAGDVWSLVPAGPNLIPVWVPPASLDTCTSTQIDGTEIGCEHEINFIQGTNITMTGTDDSDNDRTNITINASGGGAVCTDLTQVTNLYVDASTGSDSNDGTALSPWLTIQHAIDAGIPGIVCGRYIINLAAGTYVGQVNLAGRIFAGGGQPFDVTNSWWPYSTAVGGGDISDNSWEYSWVEILGSTFAPENYKIQIEAGDTLSSGTPVITTSGAYLSLRGVEVRQGGWGVLSENGSFLNLAGVIFEANLTAVQAIHNSRIHLDGSGSVDDDFFTIVQIVNGTLAAVPVNSNAGIILSDNSFMDDNPWNDAQVPLTNGQVELIFSGTGAGTFGGMYLEGQSRIHMLMQYNCSIDDPIYCLHLVASSGTIDGGGTLTGPGSIAGTSYAIKLENSKLGSELANSSATYNLSGWAFGVWLDQNSSMAPIPDITADVPTMWNSQGGNNSRSANMRSRDIFVGLGTVIQTVDFSATPTFDPRNGGTFKITLSNNVTSSSISAGTMIGNDGQDVTFIICQDGGGAHTFVWPINVKGADTIGSTGSKCNVQRFLWDNSATTWWAVAPMQKDQ